jgi:hypothetical protein
VNRAYRRHITGTNGFMRWGISGRPLALDLRYAAPITQAAIELDFPPLFLYAIAYNETIRGEIDGQWDAATVVSSDGGHGLCQLTSWWPNPGWDDPYTNAHYAVLDWLLPDSERWFAQIGATGETLVRCAAASFNAGWSNAWTGHLQGNVDLLTTNDYGATVLQTYNNLFATGQP